VGLGATHPTFHRFDVETLAGHVVLAHRHMMFYPLTCGLCRDAVMVGAALIDYVEARLLSEWTREGDDGSQLLFLH
jgi:hypothetical protein